MSDKDLTKPSSAAQTPGLGEWAGIIRATGSPLKMFALIVLVCNSIFGIAAAWSFGADIFIYTLHTFLAVVACFVLIALWSPRSFYSPKELVSLAEIETRHKGHKVFPSAQPLVPTLIVAVFVLLYGAYQYNK